MKQNRLYLFIRKYRYLCGIGYTIFYLLWFRFLEQTVSVRSGYHIMHCSLDDLIPFAPGFVIPYLLWFLYIPGVLFLLSRRDADETTQLGIFLAAGMSICLLICTLYHNGTNFRVSADPADGLCQALVWIIQRADTPTNVFPSIHVYNSMGVNAAVWHSRYFAAHPLLRQLSSLLTLSICCSTVFLKQHSLIDVAGALVLSYFIAQAVYGDIPIPSLSDTAAKEDLKRAA